MEMKFSYQLDADIELQCDGFVRSAEHFAVEQLPAWRRSLGDDGLERTCFFIGRDAGRIVSTAIIDETRFIIKLSARIFFGPVSASPNVLIESIADIYRHYRSEGFLYLFIQLPFIAGSMSDLVENRLAAAIPFYRRDDRQNKSTIRIDLKQGEGDIFADFTKGHRSAIKAGERDGYKAEISGDDASIDTLSDIYGRMCVARGLGVDLDKSHRQLRGIAAYLADGKNGFVVTVKDDGGNTLGGVVIVFQGNVARYYRGASDPARRDVSVLHLAMWAAIRESRLRGLEQFDLWGYNPYVGKEDQVYMINRFKKGFGGEFVSYSKVMHMDLAPFGRQMNMLAHSAGAVMRKLRVCHR